MNSNKYLFIEEDEHLLREIIKQPNDFSSNSQLYEKYGLTDYIRNAQKRGIALMFEELANLRISYIPHQKYCDSVYNEVVIEKKDVTIPLSCLTNDFLEKSNKLHEQLLAGYSSVTDWGWDIKIGRKFTKPRSLNPFSYFFPNKAESLGYIVKTRSERHDACIHSGGLPEPYYINYVSMRKPICSFGELCVYIEHEFKYEG